MLDAECEGKVKSDCSGTSRVPTQDSYASGRTSTYTVKWIYEPVDQVEIVKIMFQSVTLSIDINTRVNKPRR